MYDTVIGIDSGKKGYVSVFRNGIIEVKPLDQNVRKFRQVINHYQNISKNLIVYIESVDFHNMKDPAVVRRNKILIDHYRELITTMKLDNVNFREVHPRRWQKHFGLIVKGVEGYAKKKMHRDFLVNQLKFKEIAVVKADSVLILKYGLFQLQSNNAISNNLILKLC